jgi:hypothetical protein
MSTYCQPDAQTHDFTVWRELTRRCPFSTARQIGSLGGSIVESTYWMVLHRPVELAATGKVELPSGARGRAVALRFLPTVLSDFLEDSLHRSSVQEELTHKACFTPALCESCQHELLHCRLDCRGNAPARATQLPAVLHPLRVFLSAIELLRRWIAISVESPHFARICLKSPNKLQQPHVTDAKLLSPTTSRRLAGVATGPPPQRESPYHELLFLAAKRPRWMISLTLKRFSKVSHRCIIRITTGFRSVRRWHASLLPPRSCGVTTPFLLPPHKSKGLTSFHTRLNHPMANYSSLFSV